MTSTLPIGRARGLPRTRSAHAGRTPLLPVLVLLCLSACEPGSVGPPADEEPDPPATDPAVLHVAWIARLPRLAPPDTLDPTRTGWPDVGSEVEWVAHVINDGAVAAEDVAYRWRVDGEPVLEGSVTVPPGETSLVLPSRWAAERERITLELLASAAADGATHSLTVRSDALSVGLYMESPIADWMDAAEDVPSFPVWAGREVAAWNGVLDGYVGEDGEPPEVLDRLRLDRVEVLPEGADWPAEQTSDLVWYFNTRIPSESFVNSPGDRHVLRDQSVVLHELLHQRGITDLYAYRVFHGDAYGDVVLIREPDGSLAAGSSRMPFHQGPGGEGMVFDASYRDMLMGSDYRRPIAVDPHTAYGLNHVAGIRTPHWLGEHGNRIRAFAVPGSHQNDYMLHVPDSVRLRVLLAGEPAPEGAVVEAYFDHATATYRNRHGPDPDEVAVTDDDGVATISLATLGSAARLDHDIDSDVVVVRVTVDDRWGYAFLPEYELNMLYVRGQREVGEMELAVGVR